MTDLRVKIFADGADEAEFAGFCANPLVRGFTTNPTLMRKAGVDDYEAFARSVLEIVTDRPISFEVFSDEFAEMRRQALAIASWGKNVNVKIPITNTRGESSGQLLRELSAEGVQLNATALMTPEQVAAVAECMAEGPPGFVSVFAGRIADSGRDPVPLMASAVEILRPHPQLELIWASPREVLNIIQADSIGCHVITVTSDLFKKLPLLGRDLDDFSLDTVKMFYKDAKTAGYAIKTLSDTDAPR